MESRSASRANTIVLRYQIPGTCCWAYRALERTIKPDPQANLCPYSTVFPIEEDGQEVFFGDISSLRLRGQSPHLKVGSPERDRAIRSWQGALNKLCYRIIQETYPELKGMAVECADGLIMEVKPGGQS